MSERERDRLKVLHEAKKGHLTQKQAPAQLQLSERWVRKLVGRLRRWPRSRRSELEQYNQFPWVAAKSTIALMDLPS